VIIQQVIKGIAGLNDAEVQVVFHEGILCNWWRNQPQGLLPQAQIPGKLTDRNLDWHQNSYEQPDPLESGQKFSLNTPYISTTAGTVTRDLASKTNTLTPAWKIALYFATDGWTKDGWLFHCHLFIIGKRAPALRSFSEELRELNIYQGFSIYQPEGEITAKIDIPTAQIERADFWSLKDAQDALAKQALPSASKSLPNPNFVKPDDLSNIRGFLL
jgi:hypothetical protein